MRLFLLLLIAFNNLANGGVNYQIDKEIDQLNNSDRTTLEALFFSSLLKYGYDVDRRSDKLFKLYHLKLGKEYIIVLISPENVVNKRSVSRIEDIPKVYDQFLRSLSQNMDKLTRDNITRTDGRRENRIKSETLFTLSLGPSLLGGENSTGNSSFGMGVRSEFDKYGLEFNFLHLTYCFEKDN